jgi:hypothetical protein
MISESMQRFLFRSGIAITAVAGVLIIRHDESDKNSGFVHLVEA